MTGDTYEKRSEFIELLLFQNAQGLTEEEVLEKVREAHLVDRFKSHPLEAVRLSLNYLQRQGCVFQSSIVDGKKWFYRPETPDQPDILIKGELTPGKITDFFLSKGARNVTISDDGKTIVIQL